MVLTLGIIFYGPPPGLDYKLTKCTELIIIIALESGRAEIWNPGLRTHPGLSLSFTPSLSVFLWVINARDCICNYSLAHLLYVVNFSSCKT